LKTIITSEKPFIEATANAIITPEVLTQLEKPSLLVKRIGSTTYQVAIHFSKTSKETISDKISRLIRNETASRKVAG